MQRYAITATDKTTAVSFISYHGHQACFWNKEVDAPPAISHICRSKNIDLATCTHLFVARAIALHIELGGILLVCSPPPHTIRSIYAPQPSSTTYECGAVNGYKRCTEVQQDRVQLYVCPQSKTKIQAIFAALIRRPTSRLPTAMYATTKHDARDMECNPWGALQRLLQFFEWPPHGTSAWVGMLRASR